MKRHVTYLHMDTLYQEEILDHYHEPRHFGDVVPCDFSKTGFNPLCGDTVRISGRVKGGKVVDIGFTAKGCAISIAAASMLMEYVRGRPIAMVRTMQGPDMLKLVGVSLSPSRVTCGLLAWDTLEEALHER